MTENPFAKFVPGFDFMQGLVKNAGSALPGFGQWVAPTLDPEALNKRIDELRAVQFWLEQNAKMLAATIQALEVQRMTLSTLKTMNVPMADLGESLKAHIAPMAAAASTPAPAPAPKPAPEHAPEQQAKPAAKKAAADKPAAPGIDPMQWWGALSQQFTELATNAMKDVAPVAAAAVKSATAASKAASKTAAKAPARRTTKPVSKSKS